MTLSRVGRCAVAFAVAGGIGAQAPRALACAGPCAVPELWGVEQLAGETVVVTNFGLLTERDGGWLLTCEERIGGLILAVEGDARGGFVSTSEGLFEMDGDVCSYGPGASSGRSEWLLDYALARDADTGANRHFALLLDESGESITVERSSGDAFEVVHEFPAEAGFDELAVGGSPARIYLAGYPSDPREWRLSYGTEGEPEWVELSPPVENAYTTMTLLGVDPEDGDRLFVQAETVAGLGHELWRFDASSQSVERLLVLESGEVMGGFTFDDGAIWVAGRRRGGGSLYRADADTLAFERVVEDGPAFACLAAFAGELYACVNDFTYASSFLLGKSRDGGESWTPALSLGDLGAVESCGDDCALTADQLHADYGVLAESEPDSDDVANDAGVAGADEEPAGQASSGCALGRVSEATWPLLWGVVAVGSWFRRARRRAPRPLASSGG